MVAKTDDDSAAVGDGEAADTAWRHLPPLIWPRAPVRGPTSSRHEVAWHAQRMDLTLLVGVLVGLIAAWSLFVALLWVLRPRDARLRDLVRIVPDIVRLCRNVLADGRAPRGARLAIAGLLVWLVSPIDLIPEFIPILGPLDDVIVAVLVLRYVRRRLGTEDLRARWRGTPEGFALLQTVMG